MRNETGGGRRFLIVAAAACIPALMFIVTTPGCDKDTPTGLHHNHDNPIGQLVSHTDCKGSLLSGTSSDAGAIQDCFEYELVSGDTLILRHVNAAFNCCPEEITADISISNDTITIVEHEAQPGCKCLCLYDVEYRFDAIEAGSYTIRFVEPHATDADEPLRATIDLSSSPSGGLCVDRDHYPWNTSGTSEPSGRLIGRSGCKSSLGANDAPAVPGDMDCIEYHYVAGNVLFVKHINAAFNCCAGNITADIGVRNGVITIVEHEEHSMCDCSCLQTLDFVIENLEPGQYTLRIVELYTHENDDPLLFPVDLESAPSRFLYAFRTHYPWMYQSTMQADRATLAAMRKEIVEFIGVPSCGDGGECRYISLGVKPCGGPYEYLVYSTATVDPYELKFRVGRYDAYNDAFNRRFNVVSDCRYVLPPAIGCVEGTCKALNGG